MCHQVSIKIGINLACILFYKFFFFHLCLYRVHSVGVYTNMPNGGCAAGIQVRKWLLWNGWHTSVFTCLPKSASCGVPGPSPWPTLYGGTAHPRTTAYKSVPSHRLLVDGTIAGRGRTERTSVSLCVGEGDVGAPALRPPPPEHSPIFLA
jgi:hypothetical protein